MKRALLLAPLLLSACAFAGPPYSPPPPPPPIMPASASVTIGFGGRAMLNGLVIRPMAVIEDSRCPIDVRCVWAGRLILAVEIDLRGASETLRANMTLGQPLAVSGGTLTLVAAEPVKLAAAQGPPASRFTFALTR